MFIGLELRLIIMVLRKPNLWSGWALESVMIRSELNVGAFIIFGAPHVSISNGSNRHLGVDVIEVES